MATVKLINIMKYRKYYKILELNLNLKLAQ